MVNIHGLKMAIQKTKELKAIAKKKADEKKENLMDAKIRYLNTKIREIKAGKAKKRAY